MGHIRRHIGGGISITVLAMAIALPLKAQAERGSGALDEITIYGTRSPQISFDVPALISKIDADAPGNALAGDVADLLEFTPGVNVSGSPRREGQTISIRGFDDEAIITLIDGRRQNFESAHDGRFYLNMDLLKSVEIVKGSSSALYGGGAIGGVVAFETKDAADFLAPGENFGSTLSFGYRSGNSEYAPTLIAYGLIGNWDVLGSFSYLSSDDVEQGDGNKLDDEDSIVSGLLKLGYSFNDFHTVKIETSLLSNEGKEPNNGAGVINPNLDVDKNIEDYQVGVKYSFDNPNINWLNAKTHLYYNYTEVEETDKTGRTVGRVQTRELQTIGWTLDAQTKLGDEKLHVHVISYGVEVYRDEQEGTSSITMDGRRGGVPNAEAVNFGLYIQGETTLYTRLGDFLFIPALRFDRYESEDEAGNSQDENAFSPKVALTYKPIKHVMSFISWSRAFRAPNLTELYPTGQHFPAQTITVRGRTITLFPRNVFVENPNLKPETVDTLEIGAGINFPGLIRKDDRLSIKGSWFLSDGSDFIDADIDLRRGRTENVNVPNARIAGWEVQNELISDPLRLSWSLSYVRAVNEDTGEYLSNNVPLNLVADISSKIAMLDGLIGWRMRYAARNDRVGADDEPTGGYFVNDLYLRWNPQNTPWLKPLIVDFGIDNVFDRAYKKRFATLVEEGISVNFKLSYGYQW